MSKRWDEGYCPDCGTFLGDPDYLEEHWCPAMHDDDDDDYEDEYEDGYIDEEFWLNDDKMEQP